MTGGDAPSIEAVEADAFTVPTAEPESDGTQRWTSTTLVVVRVRAGGLEGLGYSYASTAAAAVVRDELAEVVRGMSALSPPAAFEAMRHALRNVGTPGVASCAVSAVDTALWDLEAKLFGVPLVELFGSLREAIPVYGSGGFTSMGPDRVAEQLGGWVESGIPMVKMKVGRDPGADVARLDAARDAIGDEAELFVDANGAFDRKEALGWAELYADWGVTWFEEPVSSNDLEGLRLLRDRAPGGMQIAAGEYAWDLYDVRDLVVAGAVDTLQVDVTRCGGYTPFLRAAALCEAHHLPLSAHCAPALHAPVMCAAPNAVHVEWFHDHVRIESMLLEGAPLPAGGVLEPCRDRPGHGLAFLDDAAEEYRR